MGRNEKDYVDLHIKCERIIYEDLKKYIKEYNLKYNRKITVTKFVEVAIYEYIEQNKI